VVSRAPTAADATTPRWLQWRANETTILGVNPYDPRSQYPQQQPYPPQYPQYPQQPPNASVVDALVPTNPLAAVACWIGILSLFTCYGGIVLGPIALVLGIISRNRGAVGRETAYGRGASTVRSWIGIVTGALSTVIGIVAIVMLLLNRR
jgi:hypothetical protein